MSLAVIVRYPKGVKLRSLAIAVLAGVSVTPTGWSRTSSLSPRIGTSSHPAAEAPASLITTNTARSNVGEAISLASITWEGAHAIALDMRGQRHALTLRRTLHDAATQLLKRARPSRGAIVMISAADGKLLALSEEPAAVPFDQSLVWSANTPSASLFKLVTTAALLERAKLQPDHRVCTEGGEHRLEVRHLEAPKQGRIVCSNFSEILASSRNAAYARLVHTHLSPEDLENFADRFGFNAPLPADVPAELGRFRAKNDPLGLVRTATGFVGSSLSALGAAYLGFVIARGGIGYRLQLLDVDDPSISPTLDARGGSPAAADDSGRNPPRVLAPDTVYRLRSMMERVVSHGTAADAFHDPSGHPTFPQLRIAGKTGTLGRDDHTASWFVGFAPSRDPKVVVAVLLENGAVWHTTAKRVAGTLLRQYFDGPK